VTEAPVDTLLGSRTADVDQLCATVGISGEGATAVSMAHSGLIPRTFDMLFEVRAQRGMWAGCNGGGGPGGVAIQCPCVCW
jgi:hypothetical protein